MICVTSLPFAVGSPAYRPLDETSGCFEWVNHHRGTVDEVVDPRHVVREVRCRVMRSRGRLVAITLLDDEAVAVSLVPPHVVLDVSLLAPARADHAGEQRSQVLGFARPGHEHRHDLD